MSLESAEQLKEVRDLIAEAFPPADLEMLVMDHLGVPLANLVSPGTHLQRVFELLQACEARGWLERLLDGVAEERQQNPEVALLMQRMGRPTAVGAAAGARTAIAVGAGSLAVTAHALSKRRDEELQALVKQLDDAYARKKQLEEIGEPTGEIAREILDLKRRLREGGQLRAGDRLGSDGRYQLIQQVGRGGFAVVWKAKDRREEMYVAIKVLHANLSGDPDRRERFFRGARIMQRVHHPAVVRVLDRRCEDGGFWYFVMEFVANGTLHDAVLRKRLAGNDALIQVIRIGEAVAAAHAQRMVHRDIKPQNILLDENLEAKLTDFDLVGAGDTTGGTRTSAMGTVIYAAPECLEKPQEATARADVFGLGMTAIFALAGTVLTLSTLRNPEPTIARLDCSQAVRQVLRRAVAWEPEQRFANAGEMIEALDRANRMAGEQLRHEQRVENAAPHPAAELAQLVRSARERSRRVVQQRAEEKQEAQVAVEDAARVREDVEQEPFLRSSRHEGIVSLSSTHEETFAMRQNAALAVAPTIASVPVSPVSGLISEEAARIESTASTASEVPAAVAGGVSEPSASPSVDLARPTAPLDSQRTEQVESATKTANMTAAHGYAKLVVMSSNLLRDEFELSRPIMTIGRGDDDDIVINHRSISRNHAKIVHELETGRYIISDLHSLSGVRVNGSDYGRVELRRGDVVDLGHVRLRFVEAGEDFVFARDAVITDVPEVGGRRGMLVALIAAIVALVAVGAVYWFRNS